MDSWGRAGNLTGNLGHDPSMVWRVGLHTSLVERTTEVLHLGIRRDAPLVFDATYRGGDETPRTAGSGQWEGELEQSSPSMMTTEVGRE